MRIQRLVTIVVLYDYYRDIQKLWITNTSNSQYMCLISYIIRTQGNLNNILLVDYAFRYIYLSLYKYIYIYINIYI